VKRLEEGLLRTAHSKVFLFLFLPLPLLSKWVSSLFLKVMLKA
jgi:hypothetical protein